MSPNLIDIPRAPFEWKIKFAYVLEDETPSKSPFMMVPWQINPIDTLTLPHKVCFKTYTFSPDRISGFHRLWIGMN